MRILGIDMGFIEFVIAVCFLIFIAVQVGGSSVGLLLALSPMTVLIFPWTIITSIFTHVGVTHLIFNMLGMYLWGSYLQALIGERRLIRVFFTGGLLGSIFSIFIYSIINPDVYVIGASGAIFAIAATLAILRPHNRVMLMPIPIPMEQWKAVFGFMLIYSFILPGIAWPGHLGGLVAGALIGYYYRKRGIGGVERPRYGHRFY